MNVKDTTMFFTKSSRAIGPHLIGRAEAWYNWTSPIIKGGEGDLFINFNRDSVSETSFYLLQSIVCFKFGIPIESLSTKLAYPTGIAFLTWGRSLEHRTGFSLFSQ